MRRLAQARRWVEQQGRVPDPGDEGAGLPLRLPRSVWLVALVFVVLGFGFMFGHAHVVADTRRCLGWLEDPLYPLVPFDVRWYLVSYTLYIGMTIAFVVVLGLQALLGDERPLVRWGVAMAFMAVERSICILCVPLCRMNRPMEPLLAAVPTLDLGLFRLPWHVFARNDLFFSGHVGEAILLLCATRTWPGTARLLLWTYLFAQSYALLATRGHYTIDLLVAVPCSYLADRLAVRFLLGATRGGSAGRLTTAGR